MTFIDTMTYNFSHCNNKWNTTQIPFTLLLSIEQVPTEFSFEPSIFDLFYCSGGAAQLQQRASL